MHYYHQSTLWVDICRKYKIKQGYVCDKTLTSITYLYSYLRYIICLNASTEELMNKLRYKKQAFICFQYELYRLVHNESTNIKKP